MGAQAAGVYAFAQTVGNGHCRFVPWSLPSKIDPDTKLITGKYQVDSPQAEKMVLEVEMGTHRFSFYRCADATTSAGGLDPPSRSSCSGLLPDARWMLHTLGAWCRSV